MHLKHLASLALLHAVVANSPALAQDGPAGTEPAAVVAVRFDVESIRTRVHITVSQMGAAHRYGDPRDAGSSLVLDPESRPSRMVDVAPSAAPRCISNAKSGGELCGVYRFAVLTI